MPFYQKDVHTSYSLQRFINQEMIKKWSRIDQELVKKWKDWSRVLTAFEFWVWDLTLLLESAALSSNQRCHILRFIKWINTWRSKKQACDVLFDKIKMWRCVDFSARSRRLSSHASDDRPLHQVYMIFCEKNQCLLLSKIDQSTKILSNVVW